MKRNSVVRLLHELKAPGSDQELPILMQDRPPAHHYWPVSVEEFREALDGLPKEDVEGITHLWLRTPSGKGWRDSMPLASITTGRGVRLIDFLPWPVDLTLHFGRSKPKGAYIAEYERYGAKVHKKGRTWHVVFTEAGARKYCVEVLLFYCVGQHVWGRVHPFSDSGASARRSATAADAYWRRFHWDDPKAAGESEA